METLRQMATALGFVRVRTYIASGNLLIESNLNEVGVKAALETALADYAGKPVPVLVRTAAELAAVHTANPFPDAIGARHLVYFFDSPPAPDMIDAVKGRQKERIALGTRELYVDYGTNIRDTKLKFTGLTSGTGRNINTVAKLVAMMA